MKLASILIFAFVSFLYLSALGGTELKSKIDDTLLKLDLASPEKVKVIVWIDKAEYAKTKKSFSTTGFGHIKYEYDIVPAIAMEIPANRLESFARQNFVKRIEPVLQVKAFLHDSVPLINANKVWNEQISGINITGKYTTICILDTGVNYTHPDLGGGFGSGYKVVAGYDFVNSDSDPMDDNGHGTHVAGITAANGGIKGVAPNASIIAIKVLNSAGGGTSDDLIAGIEWCTKNKTAYNISVISMSLGTLPPDLYSDYCDNEEPSLTAAINSAVGKNITVVAATGNNGNTTHIALPACIRNVTAVASTTKADAISSFSNRNNITDLLAPGSDINSTKISGNYIPYSGTSMATPHVAGAFALLYQKYKLISGVEPTPSYLQDLLNATGVKINDTAGNKLNFTRIDVYAASLQINDTVAPKWYNQSSNASSVNASGSILLSAHWTDNALLGLAVSSTNETGIWENKSFLALSGSSAWSNFTWSNSSLAGTVVAWRIFANDTSGNQNVTNSLTFAVIDADAPKNFNITVSDNTYSSGKVYWFNISWTDAAISKVIFEWNGTENTTFDSTQNNFYSVNRTDLAAGNYTYRWFANDTSGNWNSTASQSYNVLKANSTNFINIELNWTLNQNKTYIYPQAANASAWKNITEGSLTLYRNNMLAAAGQTPNETLLLPSGTYNYTAYYEETQNYSSGSKTYYAIIEKAPTSVLLWLDGSQDNRTYFKGAVTNITAQLNVSLPLAISANFSGNQADINSSVAVAYNLTNTSNLAVGIYNITAYYNGSNSNYSSSYKTYFLTVYNSYVNASIILAASNPAIINASVVNVTLNIVTNSSVNASVNITIMVDNPTGVAMAHTGLNRFITIKTENITGNLAYAILNISYSDVSVPFNIEESSLRLYWWNITAWVRLENGGVNTTEKYVWANITEFSNFTIGGLLANGQVCASNSNCSSGYCVHSYCRPSSTYCGDTYCDSGESCSSCSSDCGSCTVAIASSDVGSIGAPAKLIETVNKKTHSLESFGKIIKTEMMFKSAIEKILGNLTEEKIDELSQSTAEALKEFSQPVRTLTTGTGKSTLSLDMNYSGKRLKNLIIYDIIPKTFANSSDDITVSSNGIVSNIETDPVYLMYYHDFAGSAQINYTLNRNVNSAVINDTGAPIILVEKFAEKTFCAQVITPALSPDGECKEFPTPCDVPEGWKKVEKCPEKIEEKAEEEPEKAVPINSIIILILLLSIISAYYFIKSLKRKSATKKA